MVFYQAKRVTRSDDEWNSLVDEWHNGAGSDMTLYEFMGLTAEQYEEWVKDPGLFIANKCGAPTREYETPCQRRVTEPEDECWEHRERA